VTSPTAIPTSEPRRFDRLRRRTLLLRGALALALLATLAACVLAAVGQDLRQAPLVPSGKTGIVVLDLSASTSEEAFSQTIEKLANADERVGLVAFSDAAYQLLPLGTPGRELLPLLRYFGARDGGEGPAVTPWQEFRGGTRVSEGLRVARQALEEADTSRGSILLISDFEILPDEIRRTTDQVALLRSKGIEVRFVPLHSTPERRARMKAILRGATVLREEDPEAPVRAPEERSLAAAAPWAFLGVASVLVALLALNEALLARLEVRR
jgi:hypothetical protein